MKKLIALTLAATMAVSLAACGGSSSSSAAASGGASTPAAEGDRKSTRLNSSH